MEKHLLIYLGSSTFFDEAKLTTISNENRGKFVDVHPKCLMQKRFLSSALQLFYSTDLTAMLVEGEKMSRE